MFRTIAAAALVAGTLDILMAAIDTALAGGSVAGMLAGIATGPFGGEVRHSAAAPAIGLAVHFAIMAAMAAAFVLAARRVPMLRRHWASAGLLYGAALWIVMYWIVLPLRFDASLPSDPAAIAKALFAHCVLVGLPIAGIGRRAVPPR